jgi:hypothetical protein
MDPMRGPQMAARIPAMEVPSPSQKMASTEERVEPQYSEKKRGKNAARTVVAKTEFAQS